MEPTSHRGRPDARQAREEIFGPVLSVITVDSLEEAIAWPTTPATGLAASIFTANIKRALRGARAIRAGTVTVNSFGEGDISTPFGGFKASGFGGRDNGIHAHDQYTQLKTIWIDLPTTRTRPSIDRHHRARLPDHRGSGGVERHPWAGAAYAPLNGRMTADFVVVGAGFAGALRRAPVDGSLQPEARIVVLDAGRVAEGAAGRNSGFMIDLPHDLTSEDYVGARATTGR